jgi:hypothetical protein
MNEVWKKKLYRFDHTQIIEQGCQEKCQNSNLKEDHQWDNPQQDGSVRYYKILGHAVA